ncbi:MAG: hypothetical protein HY077_16655 [Elusimicrobia bacterium]|nr:hypothetical protein [Elusimicrobiota bacterium]
MRLEIWSLLAGSLLLLLGAPVGAAEDRGDPAVDADLNFFLIPLFKNGPASAEESALGRNLFFDPRLSGDNAMSCATCHNPALAWTNGLDRGRGRGGVKLPRNVPSLLNARHSHFLFWDGRETELDKQPLQPISNPLEMNQNLGELAGKLERIPDYARRFRSVYGPPGITTERIGKALAAFMRTEIHSGEVPLDRFYTDEQALTPAQRRGFKLFVSKARCILCHVGPDMTDNFFHNIGVKSSTAAPDLGRYAVVSVPEMRGAFRTAPLRNVALTAPYMHDGSLKTLRDVVDFYDRGGDQKDNLDPLMQPLQLSAAEKEDLLAFLTGALTAASLPEAVVPVLPREEDSAVAASTAAAAPKPTAVSSADAAQGRGGAAADPPESCRKRFSMDGLMTAVAQGRISAAQASRLGSALSEDAQWYYLAASFAGEPRTRCRQLHALLRIMPGAAQTPEGECREWYNDLSVGRALILNSPDFGARCRGAVPDIYPRFTADDAAAVCRIFAKYRDDPPRACAALQPRWLNSDLVKACEFQLSHFGERDASPPWVSAPDMILKRFGAFAAFRKAHRAGDPSLCGDNVFCRLLMLDGTAIAQSYADRVRDAVCAAGLVGSLP